jgi:hypothetical protein
VGEGLFVVETIPFSDKMFSGQKISNSCGQEQIRRLNPSTEIIMFIKSSE